MNTFRSIPALSALSALALALAAPAVFAQSATGQFDVRITITSTCSIDTPAATDVDFGTPLSTATNVDAQGLLNVNCTPGTAYEIALDSGLNDAGGGITARAMNNGAGVLVPYQLYTDAGRTNVWGETLTTDTFSGTGDGDIQPIPVFGRVPSANFPAGAYVDTVTATITY